MALVLISPHLPLNTNTVESMLSNDCGCSKDRPLHLKTIHNLSHKIEARMATAVSAGLKSVRANTSGNWIEVNFFTWSRDSLTNILQKEIHLTELNSRDANHITRTLSVSKQGINRQKGGYKIASKNMQLSVWLHKSYDL